MKYLKNNFNTEILSNRDAQRPDFRYVFSVKLKILCYSVFILSFDTAACPIQVVFLPQLNAGYKNLYS